MPHSSLALPPGIGRSNTRATRALFRAAPSDAPMPPGPAPTTTTSYDPPSATVAGSPLNRRRSAPSGSSSDGTNEKSSASSTASQRAYAPERSRRASSVSPTFSLKSPTFSQPQPFFDSPSTFPRRPFTSSTKRPGENSGNQSFVRAHTRHVPARGINTVVRATFGLGVFAPRQIR